MIKRLKQLICLHEIETKTESWSPAHIFIVKTLIYCIKCEKTFSQHPGANCCYVQHIQNQLMQEYWLQTYKSQLECQTKK